MPFFYFVCAGLLPLRYFVACHDSKQNTCSSTFVVVWHICTFFWLV